MAVIQISRIQVRRGQIGQDAMPQLASGEIGWAIDQQQLFIGNGAVSEGAPAVGNTEIITYGRFFDLLSQTTSTPYTYNGHQTTINESIQRTVNDKLNDFVTSYDFGANAGTTATVSLQTALNQLYLQSGANNYPLRIPAGTYYVTSTVYVPAGATIIGDGVDKTIIVSMGTGTHSTIFQTAGGEYSNGFPTISPNMGSGFTNNPPANVRISGITFQYTSTTLASQTAPLVILDSVIDGGIDNCKFIGNTTGNFISYTGIDIQGPLTTNLKISNSVFENLSYPITGNYDSTNIDIEDNKFNMLYQGITFANAITGVSPKQYGPRFVNIVDNTFDNVSQGAIYAGANTSTYTVIQSMNNTFKLNVGYSGGGSSVTTATATAPVITFNSLGNSSVDDVFERFEYNQNPLVGLTVKQMPLVAGDSKLDLKYVKTINTPISANTQTMFVVPWTTGTNVSVNYVIERLNATRRGTLTVMGSALGTTVNDEFNYVGVNGSDLTFSAKLVDTGNPGVYNSLLIQYNNPTTTGTCIATLSTIW